MPLAIIIWPFRPLIVSVKQRTRKDNCIGEERGEALFWLDFLFLLYPRQKEKQKNEIAQYFMKKVRNAGNIQLNMFRSCVSK